MFPLFSGLPENQLVAGLLYDKINSLFSDPFIYVDKNDTFITLSTQNFLPDPENEIINQRNRDLKLNLEKELQIHWNSLAKSIVKRWIHRP